MHIVQYQKDECHMFRKLKKKLLPRPPDPPTAMLDQAGNLVTSAVGVEKLSVGHHKRVLQNRPMAKKHKELKSEKESLGEERVAHAKENKSKPWSLKHIEAVPRHFKINKSRDPYGYADEVIKHNVAGIDLKEAIIILMNRSKSEQISSIIKKCKVGKKNFYNYRGVLKTTIIRSILDRLIFNEYFGSGSPTLG